VIGKGCFVPDDFKIQRTEDGRVLVILHPACAISKQAILALLAELGIDEATVIFLLPEETANCGDINDVPVVIPIDQASCDAPELDAVGRRCGQAGGRVIILLGEAFPYGGLHPIAEKYGTQCGWSAAQLGACVGRTDLASPRSSGGTPVTRPKSNQVKC
jgi:hypothetical protein